MPLRRAWTEEHRLDLGAPAPGCAHGPLLLPARLTPLPPDPSPSAPAAFLGHFFNSRFDFSLCFSTSLLLPGGRRSVHESPGQASPGRGSVGLGPPGGRRRAAGSPWTTRHHQEAPGRGTEAGPAGTPARGPAAVQPGGRTGS